MGADAWEDVARITKVYTRTGDDGTTGLGGGERVGKDSVRVTAFGEVDELNSHLGVVIASGPSAPTARLLASIQNRLFDAGADLCYAPGSRRGSHRILPEDAAALEAEIDRANAALPPLENFVLPGGAPAAAHLHVARAACRRAERAVVRLSREDPAALDVVRYLNRLSDLLFTLARVENAAAGVAEPYWTTTR